MFYIAIGKEYMEPKYDDNIFFHLKNVTFCHNNSTVSIVLAVVSTL